MDSDCCWITRLSPCFAISTMSAFREVSDLKNMVIILCLSCASCSWPAGGVLSSGCAMAEQIRRMHAARSACRESAAPGPPLNVLGSSFSATTRASWSKPTVCALTLMIGAGLAERQKLTMCTT